MIYVALLALAVVQVILGLTLGFTKRARVSQWFATFVISLAVWNIFNVLLDYQQYEIRAGVLTLSLLNKLGFFTGLLTMVVIYRLVQVFPVEKKLTKSVSVITIAGVLLSLFSLSDLVSGYFSYKENGPAEYTYGGLVFVVGLYALILIGLSIRNIVSAHSKALDKRIKQQATLLFISLIITTVVALFFIILLPIFWPEKDRLVFVGYFAPYIFTAGLFYSIVVQRFLDIRLIVARSVAYVLSLSLIGITYAFTAFIIIDEWLFKGQQIPLSTRRLIYIGVAVLFGLIFSPAKRQFDRLSNRIFYRDAYDPQVFIDNLTDALVSNTDLAKILRASSELIMRDLKPQFAEFLLAGRDQVFQTGRLAQSLKRDEIEALWKFAMDSNAQVMVIEGMDRYGHKGVPHFLITHDVSLVIKLMNRSELRGLLLVGARRSGNMYTKKDLEIFEIVADELSLAIENSLSYEEIRKFNETLQNEINEATKQLRRTNEKLKALDETKDEFISMASHQLRTPLTSVKGYVSMVLEGDAGELNEQQKKLLTQAFISSQRMVYLISDLLNVSRLRTGKFIIEPTETHLAEVVESELEQLKETAEAKGLRLTYHKPGNFPILMLDENKIRQVVMNFIDNAIYYTPADGSIVVELEAKTRTIEFRVTDSGIGVPRSEQHHLFNKFFRAENARKARPDGTGLGLFMAKKIIVAQGGAIIFKSAEGKGSTFGFSFPRSKVEVGKE